MLEDIDGMVQVDRHNLEEEAVKQAHNYWCVSELVAEARRKREDTINKLKTVEASADLNFRKDPPEGIKITEAVVRSLLDTHKEVVETREQLADYNEQVVMYEGLLNALEHKRSMISNLVRMQLSNLYSQQDFDTTKENLRGYLNRKSSKDD